MDNKRWLYLETNVDAKLTKEEMEEGWHWCCEFDYLLVGPGMQEMEYCLCFDEVGNGKTQGSRLCDW